MVSPVASNVRAADASRAPHLSAASGLVTCGARQYVIADDEHHLGVFPARGRATGRLLRILPGDLPDGTKRRKKLKPDIEALVRVPPFAGHRHGSVPC